MERGKDARAWVVGTAEELVEPKRHELGQKQVEPGVVALDARPCRPRGERMARRTGSRRGAAPDTRRSRRSIPSAWRIPHTVGAEIGVP